MLFYGTLDHTKTAQELMLAIQVILYKLPNHTLETDVLILIELFVLCRNPYHDMNAKRHHI
jgi:hypothetical protein